MNPIQNTHEADTAPQSTDAIGSNKLGKDEFVKLLITQLSNQDPTSPQDSSAFVAQLAQFANIEIGQQQNALLESMLVAQTASNQMATTGLVGKDVVSLTNELELKDGSAKELTVNLQTPAEDVTVVIKDENGKAVRTVRMGALQAGDTAFTWDGRADDGSMAADGKYTIEVVASAADGSAIDVTLRQQARVTGVSFADGVPMLLLDDGRTLSLPDIAEVRESAS